MKVTADQIWTACLQDPELLASPDGIKAVLRRFIVELPALLKDMMDKPATLRNIMEAKLRFLRYCVDNDFISAYVEVAAEDLGGTTKEDYKEMVTELFTDLLEMYGAIAKNVIAFLNEKEVSEDQVMLSPDMGLAGEALHLYRAGQLTIAALLTHQPGIITQNKG